MALLLVVCIIMVIFSFRSVVGNEGRTQYHIIGFDILNIPGFQWHIAVQEPKHRKRCFPVQREPAEIVDLTKNAVDEFLIESIHVGSLGNDPSKIDVIVFTGAFLIRTVGITVKDTGMDLRTSQSFNGGRIAEFTAVIDKKHIKQFMKQVMIQSMILLDKKIPYTSGIVPLAKISELKSDVRETQSEDAASSFSADHRVQLADPAVGMFLHIGQVVGIGTALPTAGIDLMSSGFGFSGFSPCGTGQIDWFYVEDAEIDIVVQGAQRTVKHVSVRNEDMIGRLPVLSDAGL